MPASGTLVDTQPPAGQPRGDERCHLTHQCAPWTQPTTYPRFSDLQRLLRACCGRLQRGNLSAALAQFLQDSTASTTATVKGWWRGTNAKAYDTTRRTSRRRCEDWIASRVVLRFTRSSASLRRSWTARRKPRLGAARCSADVGANSGTHMHWATQTHLIPHLSDLLAQRSRDCSKARCVASHDVTPLVFASPGALAVIAGAIEHGAPRPVVSAGSGLRRRPGGTPARIDGPPVCVLLRFPAAASTHTA